MGILDSGDDDFEQETTAKLYELVRAVKILHKQFNVLETNFASAAVAREKQTLDMSNMAGSLLRVKGQLDVLVADRGKSVVHVDAGTNIAGNVDGDVSGGSMKK